MHSRVATQPSCKRLHMKRFAIIRYYTNEVSLTTRGKRTMSRHKIVPLILVSLTMACDSKNHQPETIHSQDETVHPPPKQNEENTSSSGATLKDFQNCLSLKKVGVDGDHIVYKSSAKDYFSKSDCMKSLNDRQPGAYLFGDNMRDTNIIDQTSTAHISFHQKTHAWVGTDITVHVKDEHVSRAKNMLVATSVNLAKSCHGEGQFNISNGLPVEEIPSKIEDLFAFIDGNTSPGMASRCEMSSDQIFAHTSIDQRIEKDLLTIRLSHGPLDGPMKSKDIYDLDTLPHSKSIDVSGWKI